MRKAAAFFLLVLCALSFSAGSLSAFLGVSGTETDLTLRLLPPAFPHLLGTDELGRDVLIRLLDGGRVSLTVAFFAAGLSVALGTLLGMTAGYAGREFDALLMRLSDLVIALPLLPVLMVLSAIDLQKLGLEGGGGALVKIVILIALFGWTTVARLSRARTLTLKKSDFVLAARALGVSHARILWRHILPNLSGTVMIAAALLAGNVILLESVLSFLGLGLQPPTASWGNMLSNAQENIWDNAALALYPGLMIFLTVLSLNFLSDRK